MINGCITMHMLHGSPFQTCFIESVLFSRGHIPIAVRMLDGFNHQARFHGEGARHRRITSISWLLLLSVRAMTGIRIDLLVAYECHLSTI